MRAVEKEQLLLLRLQIHYRERDEMYHKHHQILLQEQKFLVLLILFCKDKEALQRINCHQNQNSISGKLNN